MENIDKSWVFVINLRVPKKFFYFKIYKSTIYWTVAFPNRDNNSRTHGFHRRYHNDAKGLLHEIDRVFMYYILVSHDVFKNN